MTNPNSNLSIIKNLDYDSTARVYAILSVMDSLKNLTFSEITTHQDALVNILSVIPTSFHKNLWSDDTKFEYEYCKALWEDISNRASVSLIIL